MLRPSIMEGDVQQRSEARKGGWLQSESPAAFLEIRIVPARSHECPLFSRFRPLAVHDDGFKCVRVA
jgi:hypothetical protein